VALVISPPGKNVTSGGINARIDSCVALSGAMTKAIRLTSVAAAIGISTRSVGAVRARSFISPTNKPKNAEVSSTSGLGCRIRHSPRVITT
jgi:hypothetical protein